MITKRILQVIEYRGITKYKFCADLGLSHAFLDRPREISTDKHAKILAYFPEISPDWVKCFEITSTIRRTRTFLMPQRTLIINANIQANANIFANLLQRLEHLSKENGRLEAKNEYLREQLAEVTEKNIIIEDLLHANVG